MAKTHDHNKDTYDAADKAGRAAYETELAARSPVGEILPSKYGKKSAPKKKASKKGAYKRR